VLAAFTTLSGAAERLAQSTHAGYAILNGTANLPVSDSLADTDIHRLKNSGQNIVLAERYLISNEIDCQLH
jgi:hypothetical protein